MRTLMQPTNPPNRVAHAPGMDEGAWPRHHPARRRENSGDLQISFAKAVGRAIFALERISHEFTYHAPLLP
ncbi:MAG: hypothetical protein NTW21_04705 [Verrucomicrobia bacterium]|nr:hypothetical protein [Verrucomicrobiota bacterium]